LQCHRDGHSRLLLDTVGEMLVSGGGGVRHKLLPFFQD